MKSVLIAHRGEPERWPENSLDGFQQVLKAGARYLETDVQITADGVPVLSHDVSLLKLSGKDINILETDYRQLTTIPMGYPARFAERFSRLRITPLDALVPILKQFPETSLFVELKQASLEYFGIAAVLERVRNVLDEVITQCTIISFDYPALKEIRKRFQLPVGFVLPEWSEHTRQQVQSLQPEYIFCNRCRMPPESEPLWVGSWNWVVYTVDTAAEINRFLERGIDMVETNRISVLLARDGQDGSQ